MSPYQRSASTHCGESNVTSPPSPTSWQPSASATCSKVSAVKPSPAFVASVIPATPSPLSFSAAARTSSSVFGASRPAFSNRSLR